MVANELKHEILCVKELVECEQLYHITVNSNVWPIGKPTKCFDLPSCFSECPS